MKNIFYIVAGLVIFSAQAAEQTYAERAELATNPVAKRLFTIMEQKQTNLAVAADVVTKAELLALADSVGPKICMLKTHVDIIADFDWDLILQLQAIANKHNFAIIEDRKFADIGNTGKLQYTGGVYKIAEWSDAVIAHAISGPDIIKGIEQASKGRERGMLLLVEMSSSSNLINPKYTAAAISMAEANPFVIGLIAQKANSKNRSLIKCTPGVNLEVSGDALGQNYNSPEHVIKNLASDVMIVGRGIYEAQSPVDAAEMYREAGWKAYQERTAQK